MNEYIPISFEFIDKYVRFISPEYLRLYIYALRSADENSKLLPAKELAAALDISSAKAEFILEYWASRGELVFENGEYFVGGSAEKPVETSPGLKRRVTKPSYSQKEIDVAAKENKLITALIYQSESILNKILTPSETEMLFSFYDWLGLPVEVILMLLSYAAKKGKTTKRYLETVAIDWSEKGIDSFEAAEAYIAELEKADSAEKEVRSILGIYDRGLTPTEKKYIRFWTQELKVPSELIAISYDKTVEYTGKLSFAYMDKLLQNWSKKGCTCAKDVADLDEEFYKSIGNTPKNAKKTKFNNYNDTSKTDYSALEAQLLDMLDTD